MGGGQAADWDFLYSHLLACFPGWTWEYIDDHMTVPRYLAIQRYQKDNPPLHLMVAAYFGVGKEGESGPTASGVDSDGNSLFDLFPGG